MPMLEPVPAREALVYVTFLGVAVYAAFAMARAPSLDIGFTRAEQIALSRVRGRVEEIERAYLRTRPVFEVDVRTHAGDDLELLIDAHDGRVLRVGPAD